MSHKDMYLVTINVKKSLYGNTATGLAAIAPNIPMSLLDAYLTNRDLPVHVIDSEAELLSIEELLTKLKEADPALVGVVATGSNPSASTMSMVGVLKFFDLLHKEKDIGFKTFVWGPHPTVLPERTLNETNADYLVVGEGYETITGLYEHVTGDRAVSSIAGLAYMDNDRFQLNPSPALIDVDDIPRINWQKIDPTRYRAHNWHCFGEDINNRSPYAIIWTNQGCPYPCDFCCINNLFGKRTFRFRSMQNVVDEIGDLVENHGIKNLKILDELFAFKHKRIDEFCDLLEERQYDLNMWCFARTDSVTPKMLERLKGVGVNWVAYGFESFDDDILTATNKRVSVNVQDTVNMTRDAGMNICADVIFGLWEDNADTIKKTGDFMYSNHFEWLNIYPAFAYPGTPLYDNYLKQGIISEPEKWDTYGLYSYDCEPLPTKHLSAAEVLGLRDSFFET